MLDVAESENPRDAGNLPDIPTAISAKIDFL
jgi:hypothetical protein